MSMIRMGPETHAAMFGPGADHNATVEVPPPVEPSATAQALATKYGLTVKLSTVADEVAHRVKLFRASERSQEAFDWEHTNLPFQATSLVNFAGLAVMPSALGTKDSKAAARDGAAMRGVLGRGARDRAAALRPHITVSNVRCSCGGCAAGVAAVSSVHAICRRLGACVCLTILMDPSRALTGRLRRCSAGIRHGLRATNPSRSSCCTAPAAPSRER
jgi:hypothetical protein